MQVTDIRPATDSRAARWLLQPDVGWRDLVQYGPPGFEVYVRIAFPHEDVEETPDVVLKALVTLALHTTTADRGYAAVWEGWGGGPTTPQAPRVPIPNREMLLFTGRVEELREAPAPAWHLPGPDGTPPHLLWPADQVWCLACEVDEEIELP